MTQHGNVRIERIVRVQKPRRTNAFQDHYIREGPLSNDLEGTLSETSQRPNPPIQPHTVRRHMDREARSAVLRSRAWPLALPAVFNTARREADVTGVRIALDTTSPGGSCGRSRLT